MTETRVNPLGARLVTGATRLLITVGHPIAQVRSPEIWSAMLRHYGVNMICIPSHVLPDGLGAFFAGVRQIRNLAGLIITIPHKPATLRYVDHATSRAALVGAVNFVSVGADGTLTGDITDGMGCVENMRAGGGDPRGKRTLLVGTGGVGSAIAFALADAGVSELVVCDKDTVRAEDIARRVTAVGTPCRVGPSNPNPAGFQVVVNASPVGMRPGDEPPLQAEKLEPNTIVADVIVEQTRLLDIAAARGCKAFIGTGMMNHQLEAMARMLGLQDYDFSAPTVKKMFRDIQD